MTRRAPGFSRAFAGSWRITEMDELIPVWGDAGDRRWRGSADFSTATSD